MGEKMRYNLVMRESRKPGAPRELTKLVQKNEVSKVALEESREALKAFKNKLKSEAVNYKEAGVTMRKLRSDIWRKTRVVDGCHQAITWFPIVPIIIPTPIDIN